MLIKLNSLQDSACSVKTTDENVNNYWYIPGQLYNEFQVQCTAGQWYSCQNTFLNEGPFPVIQSFNMINY